MAVQPRAQKEADKKPTRVLKVRSSITDIITVKELQIEQENDPTLRRCRELVDVEDKKLGKYGHSSSFLIHKGIMYRKL